MSVRSLMGWVLSGFVFLLFLFSPQLVSANACGFGCRVNFIDPADTGSLTRCTQNTQCRDFCATTCGRLGTSVRAVPDAANPSTCNIASGMTSGACTPCTCTPQVAIACEGTGAVQACTTGCNDTCRAYDAVRPRPLGVSNIVCGTGTAAPRCAVPPPAPPAATGGTCQFSCSFSGTREVRTEVSCTPSSPSECSSSAVAAACAPLQLEFSAGRGCATVGGQSRCMVECRRPPSVSEADRGTCNATPGTPTEGDQCLNRCQSVCRGRGMECNTAPGSAGPRCNSGRCEFTCMAGPSVAPAVDSTTCQAGSDTCASRCTAYCRERGGTCASSPAPICTVGTPSAGTNPADGTANPSGTGTGAGGGGPPQISRTAPVFRVTFPDPFGGRMTLPQIIGNVIRIAVGLTGVFFLAIFVYGGLLYLTSAGNPESVKTGRAAIVNSVIGLALVLFSYVAVSFIVQMSDQLQTGSIGAVDQSQNAQDDPASGLAPGGTTAATGRSSQGGGAPAPGGSTPPAEPGTPDAACRAFYRADPATCEASRGGPCPNNARDISGLLSVWGRGFPAPTTAVPDPAGACRTCLENGIRGLQGVNPGLTTSCMPALVNLWNTTCHQACNPQTAGAPEQGTPGTDICNPNNYALEAPLCVRCMNYWNEPSRASIIEGVGCPNHAGKVLVWCAGAESPSRTRRPESGGYCTFSAPQR